MSPTIFNPVDEDDFVDAGTPGKSKPKPPAK